MPAFLFTLGIISYLALLGNAALSVFQPRIGALQTQLISPTLGLAVLILPVFFVNRLGIPVKQFGALLTYFLLVASVAILIWKRPAFSTRSLIPYIAIVIAGLMLAAQPMFRFGFNWISFANDDMANYSLGAQRFYESGFFAPPDLESFFQGRDYSQAFWFMHVMNNTRSGSELLLANVWAATGVNPHRAFMSVVFALHGALIFSAAALVARDGAPKKAAVVTAILVAISPMTTLGALYQLIAQVGGLTLLCVSASLLCCQSTSPNDIRFDKIKQSIPTALVCACLFVYYPEVIPFLVAAFLFYTAWTFLALERRDAKHSLATALVVLVLVVVTLNTYLYDAMQFLLSQASGGVKQSSTTEVLFPYFLIPSGLAVSWGLTPIANDIQEPLASILILTGVFGYIVTLFFLFRQLGGRPSPVVSVVSVMMCVAIVLFVRNNDFGLFKLVMFVQPFVLGVVSVGVLGIIQNKLRIFAILLLSILAVFNLTVQFGYMEKSTGEILGSLGELPFASRDAVIEKFATKQATVSADKQTILITNTSHIVLAKMQAMYTRGQAVIFPSRQFLVDLIEGELAKILRPEFSTYTAVAQYKAQKDRYLRKVYVPTGVGENGFLQVAQFVNQEGGLELTPGGLDVYNRYAHNADSVMDFRMEKSNESKLNFVHSDLGQHYYLGRAGNISSYALENDPMFAGRQFSGFGRHFVFAVQSEEPRPRVVMELTSTLTKQFASLLPNAKVQGTTVGFVGRGTGRVFSSPMVPFEINGRKYIAIDIGRNAAPMQDSKSGLMLMYGRNIRLDRRLLTTFGRDISLVSSLDFDKLIPPSIISKFPYDLMNKNLEYSGIYEDGWISEHSFFELSTTSGTKQFTVKGSIPEITDSKFTSSLSLKIDGKEVMAKSLGLGSFEINIPYVGIPGKHRVELSFAKYQQLPGADGRIAAGYISLLGFD